MIIRDATHTPIPERLYEKAWAESYELTDLQLSSLGQQAIEVLDLRLGDVVLDIGCGTGQTLLQLAEQVGKDGQVIGVDVAPSLLEIAKQRVESQSQVSLIQADASSLEMPSNSADAVFSRFGVMMFDNAIAAFNNFVRILKPAGRLAFTCWRSLEENELDYFPLYAAGLSIEADKRPFSFSDSKHIFATLQAAGFQDMVVQPHDEKVSSGNIDAMTNVLLKVGPLGKIIRENPSLRTKAEKRVREALGTLGDPSRVELTASAWVVSARTST